MSSLSANQETTLHLPAGQVLSVSTSDAAGSAIRMARVPGGGDPQSITAIAGSNLTFGPYALPERFKIVCTAGTISVSMAPYDPESVSHILAEG
jgi:hypothetical protein